MGPHELILLGDGRTLAVCNGGIETHPDFGRAKLNIATMKPSFVLVDRTNGDLIEKHELPRALHQLSIRHMDIDASGAVWFGCQHEGPASQRPLLVGVAERGKELRLMDMPDKVIAGLRNYIGSVAAHRARARSRSRRRRGTASRSSRRHPARSSPATISWRSAGSRPTATASSPARDRRDPKARQWPHRRNGLCLG